MEALEGAHSCGVQDGAVLACDCGVINSARYECAVRDLPLLQGPGLREELHACRRGQLQNRRER